MIQDDCRIMADKNNSQIVDNSYTDQYAKELKKIKKFAFAYERKMFQTY